MAILKEEFKKSEVTKEQVEERKMMKLNGGAKKCWIEEEPDKWILCTEW
ncbi:MAG: hypothetical protein HYV59_12285 [Planctomycetes bacterium]|nr:hypothetical protein [Planctomycetota bacterium]